MSLLLIQLKEMFAWWHMQAVDKIRSSINHATLIHKINHPIIFGQKKNQKNKKTSFLWFHQDRTMCFFWRKNLTRTKKTWIVIQSLPLTLSAVNLLTTSAQVVQLATGRVRFWAQGVYIQSSVQFSSVAQSCPTLCDPMNRSTPGLPVHHQHLEFTQTHVHRVSDAIQPSHPLSSPSPLALNPSQQQNLFQWVNSSHEVAKILEFQL